LPCMQQSLHLWASHQRCQSLCTQVCCQCP
jgi:hypothetical protein